MILGVGTNEWLAQSDTVTKCQDSDAGLSDFATFPQPPDEVTSLWGVLSQSQSHTTHCKRSWPVWAGLCPVTQWIPPITRTGNRSEAERKGSASFSCLPLALWASCVLPGGPAAQNSRLSPGLENHSFPSLLQAHSCYYSQGSALPPVVSAKLPAPLKRSSRHSLLLIPVRECHLFPTRTPNEACLCYAILNRVLCVWSLTVVCNHRLEHRNMFIF